MYISNIENGKNNPPSNKKDLDALAKILDLTKEELITFYEVAAEDRNTLPPEMIKYIHECSDLKNIIRFGLNKKKTNSYWQQIKKRIMEEM